MTIQNTILTAALLLSTASCSELGEYLAVTQIQVLDEDEILFPDLEVEVHMVDANNGQLIGCSGERHGLGNVDEDYIVYDGLRAHFVPPDAPSSKDADSDTWIAPSDVQGRTIELWVIEDDSEPCPGPIADLDDIIGVSEPFPGESIVMPTTISFDDVGVITLEILP